MLSASEVQSGRQFMATGGEASVESAYWVNGSCNVAVKLSTAETERQALIREAILLRRCGLQQWYCVVATIAIGLGIGAKFVASTIGR